MTPADNPLWMRSVCVTERIPYFQRVDLLVIARAQLRCCSAPIVGGQYNPGGARRESFGLSKNSDRQSVSLPHRYGHVS